MTDPMPASSSVFTTTRLVVRPFRADDWAQYFALVGDPEVARWEYNDARTEAHARERFAILLDQPTAVHGGMHDYAVARKSDDLLIGEAVYRPPGPPHQQTEIGYSIVQSQWGSGYATELVGGLLNHCFQIGAHRVYAIVEPRNLASVRVLEKAGMRREAHLIENCWVKGEWQSEYIYAILAQEFASA